MAQDAFVAGINSIEYVKGLITEVGGGVSPRPTALEVAILDIALLQHPEPIYGYGLKDKLEYRGLRESRTNHAGLYRALGKCAEHGWLSRNEMPILPAQGPMRITYRTNDETLGVWLFGLRTLIRPALDVSFGRGRKK